MIPTYVGFTIACSRLIEYLVIWNILLIIVKRGKEFFPEIGSFWCFFFYRDILTEAATGGVLWKRMFLKFHKIFRKTHVSHVSSFNKAATRDSGKVWEFSKNTLFTEHLWMIASVFGTLPNIYDDFFSRLTGS